MEFGKRSEAHMFIYKYGPLVLQIETANGALDFVALYAVPKGSAIITFGVLELCGGAFAKVDWADHAGGLAVCQVAVCQVGWGDDGGALVE